MVSNSPEFDPSQIETILIDDGPKEYISQTGVTQKHEFALRIKNNSAHPVKWMEIEFVTRTESSKDENVYSSYMVDGTSKTSSSTYRYTTTYWNKIPYDKLYSLKAGEQLSDSIALTFNSEKQRTEFNAFYVYLLYGELEGGRTFKHQRATPIDFNGNSASKTTSTKVSLCFVTTVVFGDPDHETVAEYRWFRDTLLINSAVGNRLIDAYNKYGPSWAQAVERHPSAKLFLRPIFSAGAIAIKSIRR